MATRDLTGHHERPVFAPRMHDHTLAGATASPEGRARFVWAGLRIALGWVFLWAFLDKLLGLGFSTPASRAWLTGGSPTRGFLGGSTGMFAGAFQSVAGNPAVDALFMLGLLAVGLALMLGIGMRIAAVSGTAMMLLMWLAAPPRTNPFMDDHLIYAALLFGLAAVRAGHTWGLGARWSRLRAVREHPLLE